jgi:glycosyltransferase involved in cell wall biosynthesis
VTATPTPTPVIAVNARFVTQPLTGVQRYAHEIVGRLAATTGWRIRLLLPPDRIVDLEPGQSTVGELDERWWGARGHLWEQTRLPLLYRRSGADLLLSPAGWGPLTVRRQLAVIFDLHPITHPEHFVRAFRIQTRVATPVLAHVPPRVAVISEHVRDQVVRHLRVQPDRVDIVPPAVGPPFIDRPLADPATRGRGHALFVGGDKAQKNLRFVLDFWPEVHERLGLELVVTERSIASRVGSVVADPPGVRRVQDPGDDELVHLYESALCLLWPSVAEGYGIPLLEAMAVGTPFLSADVGAARELAPEGGRVLPLERQAWIDQLVAWTGDPAGLAALRQRAAEAARLHTWERSATLMGEALERSLAQLERRVR